MNQKKTTTQQPAPWIGNWYAKGGMFGARILIVGESTYADPGVDTTRYNVLMAQDHLDGYRDAFRTKLVRAFLNTGSETQEEISRFWHSVCYLNFITVPLSGPRIVPDIRMWSFDKQPLDSVLEFLNPKLVVALGYRMWDRWLRQPPCTMHPGPEIDGAGRSLMYRLSTKNSNEQCLAYALRHPSSGFSWKREHLPLMKAIEHAKG